MTGTPLSILTAPLHLSGTVSQQSGLSAYQLEMFGGLQKSLDRTGTSLMKCMGDVLRYRKLSKCPALWASILELWEQAARVYSRKVRTLNVCSVTFFIHTPTPHHTTPLHLSLDYFLPPPLSPSALSTPSLPTSLPTSLHNTTYLFSHRSPTLSPTRITHPHTPPYTTLIHTHTHTHPQ